MSKRTKARLQARDSRSSKSGWWVLGAVAVAASIVAVVLTSSKPTVGPATDHTAALTPTGGNAAGEVAASRLIGRWQRPDGGYLLDIRSASHIGSLDAGYFNPRPINVSHAEWQEDTNGLSVFVELRDVNYPGATYRLRYRPDLDQLAGEYFQPLHQQKFDVYFVRVSKQPTPVTSSQ